MPSKVYRAANNNGPAAWKVAIVTLALLIFVGCQRSESIPAEIVGDSMAPLLCGKRRIQSCPQCELTFQHSAGVVLESVHCPHCGAAFAPSGEARSADRVSVTPQATANRWDVIAFKLGDDTLIKRVVGLPGEVISISGGSVEVDNEVIAKPDYVIDQMKRLVFDSAFYASQARLSLRFVADRWNAKGRSIIHRPVAGEGFDWIAYHHQRKYPHCGFAAAKDWMPIEDDDGFNQHLSRNLHVVDDLMVQTEVTLSKGATFGIQRLIGQTTYQVTLSVDRPQLMLEPMLNQHHQGGIIPRLNGEILFSGGEHQLSFQRNFRIDTDHSVLLSNLDRRIRLTVDEELLVDVAEFIGQPAETEKRTRPAPYLKFGFSKSSTGSVIRCRIWRDIHYFVEAGMPKHRLPVRLGAGEYFVIGDNVPVSRDSRHFGPVKNVIGVVEP